MVMKETYAKHTKIPVSIADVFRFTKMRAVYAVVIGTSLTGWKAIVAEISDAPVTLTLSLYHLIDDIVVQSVFSFFFVCSVIVNFRTFKRCKIVSNGFKKAIMN